MDAIAPASAPRADVRGWTPEHWRRALEVAEWHRLSPVLFHHLSAAATAPPEVLAELEQAYLANAARNLFIGASLRSVLAALAAAEIPAMLLKGAALIETVYPDPALREMLDLDLLVPLASLDAANAALTGIGYRPVGTGEAGPARLEHHHDPALVGEQGIVAVELHYHIAMESERAWIDMGDLWARARPAPAGPAHLLPSPEDLLVHVCFHFTRNRLGGSHRRRSTGGALGQLCDVARLVESESLDWDALVATVRASNLGARVFLALFAAREVGVAIPVSALEALRPAGFSPGVGRRLVELRVLRTDGHLPVRSLRWMVAPPRDVLKHGWDADPGSSRSLARAYVRRARAQAPRAGSALRRPWSLVQDYRLNGQIQSLERRE